mgnify:CR=1 FL=1
MKKTIAVLTMILLSAVPSTAFAAEKNICSNNIKYTAVQEYKNNSFLNNCFGNIQIPNIGGGNTNNGNTNNGNTQKPDDNGYNSSYEQKVLNLVNKERRSQGLSALSLSAEAQQAARVRAKEIVSSFSHTRPNGTSCFTVLNEIGAKYTSAGENIAKGQKTPEQVVEAWMNSPSHRANILSSKYTKLGVGCYFNGSNTYWAQMFLN